MSYRKTNTQKLGDAIKEMLRLNGIDEKIDEHQLIRSWEKTVGPLISKHTTEIYISGKKLFVKVDSAPLKQELQYSKTKLMKDLNEQVGKVVNRKVVLPSAYANYSFPFLPLIPNTYPNPKVIIVEIIAQKPTIDKLSSSLFFPKQLVLNIIKTY